MATKRRGALPSVVIAGRPNVGKSTLFNRITRSRKAIVTMTPGTTRDLVAEDAEWCGVNFRLVDSGGMFGVSDDPLELKVLERGQLGIDSADVIVFVVDAREGLVPPGAPTSINAETEPHTPIGAPGRRSIPQNPTSTSRKVSNRLSLGNCCYEKRVTI